MGQPEWFVPDTQTENTPDWFAPDTDTDADTAFPMRSDVRTVTPPTPSSDQETAQTRLEVGVPDTTLSRAPDPYAKVPGMVGGIAGGLTGGKMTPTGSLAAGTVAAGAEGFYQLGQHATGSEYAPKTGGEAFGRMKDQFVVNAAGEALGRVTGKGLLKWNELRRQNKLNGLLESEYGDLIELSQGLEHGPFPAEVGDGALQNVLHNVASGSAFGGGGIQNYTKARTEEWAKKYIEPFMKTSTGRNARMDPDVFGDYVYESVKANLQPVRNAYKKIYERIGEIVEPKYAKSSAPVYGESKVVGASGRPYQTVTGQMIEEVQVGGAMIDLQGIGSFLEPIKKVMKEIVQIDPSFTGSTIVENMSKNTGVVSYKAAKMLRSSLLDIENSFLEHGLSSSEQLGRTRQMVKIVDNAMARGLRQFDAKNGANTYSLWRKANEMRRAEGEMLENKIVSQALRFSSPNKATYSPERLESLMFKRGGITAIREMKKATGESRWKTVADNFAAKVVEPKEGEVMLSGLELGRRLSGYSRPVLHEAIGKERTELLYKVKNALETMEKKQGQGIGSAGIQFSQWGILVSASALPMAWGDASAGKTVRNAALVLGGPYVWSKIMRSPAAQRYFIQGLKLPAGTPQATAVATKLIAELYPNKDQQEVINELPTIGEEQTMPQLPENYGMGEQQ